jgi:hypothetical protein
MYDGNQYQSHQVQLLCVVQILQQQLQMTTSLP